MYKWDRNNVNENWHSSKIIDQLIFIDITLKSYFVLSEYKLWILKLNDLFVLFLHEQRRVINVYLYCRPLL